jgi:hypothetical protein
VNFSIPGYPDSILNSDITFHWHTLQYKSVK